MLLTMADEFCISCKRKITNLGGAAKFMCPNCSKYMIARCVRCRRAAVKYTCPDCGFQGPN